MGHACEQKNKYNFVPTVFVWRTVWHSETQHFSSMVQLLVFQADAMLWHWGKQS